MCCALDKPIDAVIQCYIFAKISFTFKPVVLSCKVVWNQISHQEFHPLIEETDW